MSGLLPAYSLQFILIERRWRYVLARWVNQRWWHDLGQLERATDALLSHFTAHVHSEAGSAIQLARDLCQPA